VLVHVFPLVGGGLALLLLGLAEEILDLRSMAPKLGLNRLEHLFVLGSHQLSLRRS
jgi:hypothetical protein